MQEGSKYRSIKAFRDYGKAEKSQEINPTRILALIKRANGAMEKGQIAEELGTDIESVDKALVTLLQQGIVTIVPGPDRDPEKDNVKLF